MSLEVEFARLTSIIGGLRRNPIVSISAPASLFELCLGAVAWPTDLVFRHLPASFETDLTAKGFSLPPDLYFGTHYERILIAGMPKLQLRRDDSIAEEESLDEAYKNLKSCSALHLDCGDDTIEVVCGSLQFLDALRPIVFLRRNRIPASQILRIVEVLKSVGYSEPLGCESLAVAAETAGADPSERRYAILAPADPVADPDLPGDLRDWRTARQSVRARLVAGTDRALTMRRAAQSWTRQVPISSLATTGMEPVRDFHGCRVRWTGPCPESTVALHVPVPGTYRVAFRVLDYAQADYLGLGKIRATSSMTGKTIWTNDGKGHWLEADVVFNHEHNAIGKILSLITPDVTPRIGHARRIGIAIDAMNIECLSVSQ